MTIYKVIAVGVAVLVCCIALSAILPGILLNWYSTDTSGMAFDEKPDKIGLLSWKMMPFFGLVIVGLMFAVALKNAL